jgi:catechol 2,3-dioxygenase-like lactoylglutathione lyase family enzyme
MTFKLLPHGTSRAPLHPMKRLIVASALALSAQSLCSAEPARTFQISSLYHVGYWVRDVAKSRAFYHDFLGYEEPYFLNTPDGKLQMVVMKVSERQVIYLFNNPSRILPNGDNLDHLGLETNDLAAFRAYLLGRGVKVGEGHRGRIGDFILTIKDPDGRPFEVTQFAPEGQKYLHQGKGLAPGRVSARLLSARIAVADLDASLRFYRDLLGFGVVGPPAADGSVRVRVPDGSDTLVLAPYAKASGPEPRAVPEYTMQVPDLGKAADLLAGRARALGIAPPSAASVSAFGEKEFSCTDPDGTRVWFTAGAPDGK